MYNVCVRYVNYITKPYFFYCKTTLLYGIITLISKEGEIYV